MQQYMNYKTHNDNIMWYYFTIDDCYYIIHKHYGETHLTIFGNYDEFKNELIEYEDYYCLEKNNIEL